VKVAHKTSIIIWENLRRMPGEILQADHLNLLGTRQAHKNLMNLLHLGRGGVRPSGRRKRVSRKERRLRAREGFRSLEMKK